MIVCQTCGHQNKDDESFCANCGAYLEWVKAGPPTDGAPPPDGQSPVSADVTPAAPPPVAPPAAALPPAAAPSSTPPPAPAQPGPAVLPGARPGAAADAPTDRVTVPTPPPSVTPARKPPPATPPRQPGPEAIVPAPSPSSDLAGLAGPQLGPNEVACPTCGTANDLDRTFCKTCGSLLRPAAQTEPVPAAAPRQRFPLPPAALAALAIGAMAIVVLAVILVQPPGPPGASGSAVTPPSLRPSTSTAPASAAGSQPASEAPSAVAPNVPSGLIAYASNQDDEWGIWVVPAEGGEPTEISTANGMDWDPDLSFEGTSIVWSAPGGIRMGTIESGESFLFTHHGTDDFNPAWAPDGARIAFSSKRDGRWEIYLREATEGATDLPAMTRNNVADFEPSWSPDSNQLVFTRGEKAASEIITIDVTTKAETVLTDNGVADEDPAWSPDDSRIVFARGVGGGSDLFIFNLDDKSVAPLATTPDINEHDPAWSPDSEFIVYQADGQLHIIELDTGKDAVLDLPGANAWASWR